MLLPIPPHPLPCCQAIDMYVRARKQLRWAVKLSIVLALVAMVVLAANMGLGWAVVKLTQVRRPSRTASLSLAPAPCAPPPSLPSPRC